MFAIILISIILLIFLVLKRIKIMSVLEQNGIPGPKPHYIYGNIKEFGNESVLKRHEHWIKKYGKVMGYYVGVIPHVLVADPELVKNIQIKDFNNFSDRPHIPIGLNPFPNSEIALTRCNGRRWKEMRTILTATFSASKLKLMNEMIDRKVENLIELIANKSESDQEFDIYDMFQRLTTDVIASTAFGMQTNVINDPNDRFLKAVKQIFQPRDHWINLLITCFPETGYVLYPFRRFAEIIRSLFNKSGYGLLLGMASDIIKLRKHNPNLRRKDLLQLMLDTKVSDREVSNINNNELIANNNNNESQNKSQNSGLTISKKDIHLTQYEIQANCALFFAAGSETTSTLLGFAAHVLVNNPDIQENIRKEIQEIYESDGILDYNTVSKLQYMECFINETLRVYPPVIEFVSRQALKDYSYESITLPRGSAVVIPTYYLHHDPDYWVKPEKFDPMRFSTERKSEIHPSSWQPFGDGPRNCVGLRFGMFEAKLALAKILQRFRLESGPNTEMGEPTLRIKHFTLGPKNGVFVKAVRI